MWSWRAAAAYAEYQDFVRTMCATRVVSQSLRWGDDAKVRMYARRTVRFTGLLVCAVSVIKELERALVRMISASNGVNGLTYSVCRMRPGEFEMMV